MLETTETLLPSSEEKTRCHLRWLRRGRPEELERLLTTLGVKTVANESVTTRRVNPATYIGKGKLDEIKQKVVELEGRCRDL